MTAPLVQVRVRASWMSAPVLSEWTAAAKTVAGVSPVTPNTHAKVCESWPHPKPFPRMLPSLRDQRTWSAPSKSQPSGAAKTHETERTSPSTPCRTALRASRKPGCQLAVLLTRSASCGEAAAAAVVAAAARQNAKGLDGQRHVQSMWPPNTTSKGARCCRRAQSARRALSAARQVTPVGKEMVRRTGMQSVDCRAVVRPPRRRPAG
mmetsp:Transcript_29065/g.94633  ORF Transcript_29065/g.94633 Transcript_29065/m.94633 type:complete len:207 (+) Transcript_29065:95-715(+)